MRTIGSYLIFAAVALRGVVVLQDTPQLGTVITFLAVYGLLLLVETWNTRRKQFRLLQTTAWHLVYLFLQSVLVLCLLAASNWEDFFAVLFIPLSLLAVSFWGSRFGFLCIGVFSLAITGAMLYSDEGQAFGLAMAVLYSGMCFLFGGYANQVLKAETAHNQNRAMFLELEGAHRQLQGYADQVTSLAIEHERNRLARDLHDSVTQTVFSMNLAAQSARLLLTKDPSRAAGQLVHLEDLATHALGEIQSLVLQLRPRSIGEEGLPAALRQLAEDRTKREGLKITLEIHGEKTLSDTEIRGLYSIAHEALTNVIKHSRVCEATVRLKLGSTDSYLEISDPGIGFDSRRTPNLQGHLGLVGMSERASEIGWQLCVESKLGQGTRILVSENPQGGVR